MIERWLDERSKDLALSPYVQPDKIMADTQNYAPALEILRRAIPIRVSPARRSLEKPQSGRRDGFAMKKVLVIDDHEPSRRQLVESLRCCGYLIAGEGASGKVALALSQASGAEVLVMAVGLADLDGIEAAHEIMRASPLPIVLITSHADPSTVARATNAGVMSYLVKPLRVEELSAGDRARR